MAYPSGCLAVWDVDRTLTRSDTLLPFLRAVVGRRAWASVLPAVASDVIRRRGGRAELKDALLRHCLADQPESALQEIADRFAQYMLATGCRPDALERWAWHRARGDALALASASPGIYLRPLGTLLGAHHVLATELESIAGRLTGARSAPNCRGAEKARRIAGLIAELQPEQVWVYSDSRSDRPSLAQADVAIRVRPFRRLANLPTAAAGPHADPSPTSRSPK